MRSTFPILVSVCCSGLLSCSEPFEPKGPFEEQLVVYSLLTTQSDIQYVRVYTTYNPDGFDPFTNMNDKQVDDATVLLTGPEGTMIFQLTALARDDSSRYTSEIHPYVYEPFKPTPGAEYTLNVGLPSGGSVSGTVSVPGSGDITLRTPYIVQNPSAYNGSIDISTRLSAKTRGRLVRMYVEFVTVKDNVTQYHRVEVPSSLSGGESPGSFVYPSLQRRLSESNSDGGQTEIVHFSNAAYRAFLSYISSLYSGSTVNYQRAVFILYQVEPNLYNYYNIVNGFRDEISIRSDEPDHTSFLGGRGVFGAMTVDSAFYSFR